MTLPKHTETPSRHLYEHMRTIGINHFRIIDLDTTASGLFEAGYVRTLTQAGYKLLNASAENSKVTKQRDYTWREINCAVDRAMDVAELAKSSAERRNRLHNDAQNLTKPELVRQRLTNSFPTAEELDAYEWVECPPEMPPRNRLPKDTSTIKAEYCKFSDYMLFIARRKHQAATYLKNTRFATTPANRTSWQKCDASKPHIHMIERLLTTMPDRRYWTSTSTYAF
jgi:hypothetical protein